MSLTLTDSDIVRSSESFEGAVVVKQSIQDDHFTLALLSCIFCFFPTGLVAIYYSLKVRDELRDEQYIRAYTSGNRAETFALLSIVIGICLYIICIVLGIIFLAYYLEQKP